ncbi:uncharacterized protein B0I36DRAFT_316549 [Microdochium trichocladiopsis]|uniref:Uncharacterized protein n=1 Tax=Microdochium trichocladiopsis TaxID=1682393 RepID=A0A9P8YAV4_9PEZI|nr:uncharacterized protein B0I36DRAFT_316549 [Microdochium trichocladiopsis]KAH7034570.1 hypothetical protein B0I36DRAFT_316549 [Microdochium trichocladiopsis]
MRVVWSSQCLLLTEFNVCYLSLTELACPGWWGRQQNAWGLTRPEYIPARESGFRASMATSYACRCIDSTVALTRAPFDSCALLPQWQDAGGICHARILVHDKADLPPPSHTPRRILVVTTGWCVVGTKAALHDAARVHRQRLPLLSCESDTERQRGRDMRMLHDCSDDLARAPASTHAVNSIMALISCCRPQQGRPSTRAAPWSSVAWLAGSSCGAIDV